MRIHGTASRAAILSRSRYNGREETCIANNCIHNMTGLLVTERKRCDRSTVTARQPGCKGQAEKRGEMHEQDMGARGDDVAKNVSLL